MKCGHERVKSVNGVVSCMDCGEILPDYFKTAGNVQKQAEKPPEDAKPGKNPRAGSGHAETGYKQP